MAREDPMKRLARRTALVVLIWLTAASTLVAGLPHFDCVCPDGHRKSLCLGFAVGETGCCCGGACCSSQGPEDAVAVEPESGGSCCCHGGQGNREDTPPRSAPRPARPCGAIPYQADHGLQLTSPSCVRTVVPADEAAPPAVDHSGPGFPAVQPFALPAPHPALAVSSPALSWNGSWRLSHAPPPSDLVITFLHLVI
jgi:hypothetical protein